MRDYRPATAPMMYGEKAVIRVLAQDLSKLTIKSAGYSEPNRVAGNPECCMTNGATTRRRRWTRSSRRSLCGQAPP